MKVGWLCIVAAVANPDDDAPSGPQAPGKMPPSTEHKGALRQGDAAGDLAVSLFVPQPIHSLFFSRSEVFQTRNWDV